MKNIKILMLLDNPFISDARVEKEALSLQNTGAEVTIICTSQDGIKTEDVRNGLKIRRIIGEGYNAPLRKRYSEYLKKTANMILRSDFDVLHCHDFYTLSIGVKVKESKPSIKLIYDSHEYLKGWPFYKTSEGLNKLKGKLVWNKLVQKEKKEIRQADAVITITDAIAEKLKINNSLAELPSAIGNYPIKINLNPDKTYFQQKFGMSKNTVVIIHSGTIYYSNAQLKQLFDCLKEETSVALVFAGNRPRFNEVQTMADSDKTLKDKVFFHEYYSDQSKNIEMLSTANIGLLHVNQRWEAHEIGFSNRFVEYVMAGLAVVATPQLFTREINKKHKCSVFYSHDSQTELQKAIKSAVENHELLSSAANLAKVELDWSSESDKLIKIYSDLLNVK